VFNGGGGGGGGSGSSSSSSILLYYSNGVFSGRALVMPPQADEMRNRSYAYVFDYINCTQNALERVIHP